MIDPKDNLASAAPRKGNCYICGVSLEKSASIQVQASVPIVKLKKVVGRGCIPCAKEFRALVDLRIEQALRGEYQA